MRFRVLPVHRSTAWWTRAAIIVLALSAGLALTGAVEKKNLLQNYPPPGEMVDVGGFRMHIRCTGHGSPTVILIGGLDDFSITWSLVQPAIARQTEVCSYDRAGLGWSEPSPHPRTSTNMVRELHTLLVNANVQGPYVIVGHSFGGALAQLYIHEYPGEAVGLVLVDAAPTQLFKRIPSWRNAVQQKMNLFSVLAPFSSAGLLSLAPNEIPNRGFSGQALGEYRAISAATGYYATCVLENRMFEANLAEIHGAHISSIGAIPLIVVSRGKWDPMPGLSETENEYARRAWADMQRELLQLSSNSKQVIATNSEHFIQLQQPQSVIDAIQKVIIETR